MGTAPSAEIVCDAPFRAPQGGARQVALIPIVEQYFPTPDCPLFKQLYEAYTDPSVRYYMRPNFDGKSGDLSRIPPIENSCEDMHRLLLRHTAQGMFPTNAAIREVYEVGDFYRIRPVLCAVVFLYEGTSYMPEGSVQLSSPSGGASAFAKVIGIIGDTCTLVNKPDDLLIPFGRDDVLRIRTLIMKSAGDHNMSRVVLLAAYIYYHQCCSIIGLPNIPALPFSFMCFKTNIPFLCFLREMRDRMANVLEAPKSSKFFIDEHCLHGVVSREYVAKMMPAFACYYISFLKAKSEQRALKQPAQQQQQQHLLTDCGGKDRAGWTANSLVNRADTHLGSVYTEAANSQAVMAIKAAALEGVLNDGSNTAPKITYVVKGYITRSVTSISNWSHAANEVYVACVDSTVRVVDRTSVEARDGPTRTPSLVYQADPIEGDEAVDGTTAAVAIIQVHRGDILSFYVPSGTRSTDASPTFGVTAAQAVNGDDNIFYGTPHLETLKFSINMSSSLSFEAPSRHDSASFAVDAVRGSSDEVNASTAANSLTGATGVDGNATPFEAKKGSWRVDDNIFIENVLLSLVRDECKLAREATRQDPGWVYDPLHKCLVHDGSFYVWHFRRGHEDFYYGTVPKFANPNRQLSRKSGGGSGGNVEQGKTNRGGVGSAGASKDPGSGSRNATARGRNDNASPLPSAMNSSTAQVDALPPSVPPLPNQNRLSQPLSPPPHLQHTALLPPTLATASPLVQQAYLASIAASASLPPPPAYDASTLSAVQAAPMPFTANTGQRRPKNPTYATYSAEAAAMAPAGVPMMYTFMHPTQAQSQLAPTQQQHTPLQDLYTLPPQGMHSHGMSPPPPSPQQQQAVWSMLGADNGQATAASSHSIRPCIVNAQGQFIPLENVMGGGIAPAPRLSYTQPAATATPPLYPSYVMVNGQLCILQSSAPSAAVAAPLPPQPNEQYLHMMAFRQ